MANPLLNEKAFTKAVERTPDQAGWGSAEGKSTWNAPISDGPVSPYISAKAPGQTMTANGAMSATMFLMVLLIAAATFGWSQVTELESGQITIPSWVMGGVIVGLICAFGVMFKPTAARFLAPVYAIAQGSVVGAISKMFNVQYPGARDRQVPSHRYWRNHGLDGVLSRVIHRWFVWSEHVSNRIEHDEHRLQRVGCRPCRNELGARF
ncbi:hypothetical protein EBW23_01235 [bacterium]|nr:hypothetical protein [bacterium]